MIRMLVPISLVIAGLAAGIGAGLAFRPQSSELTGSNDVCDPSDHAAVSQNDALEGAKVSKPEEDREYVKLNNQFVVPVVSENLVEALVVMSLSVEIKAGQREVVYAREPKLRDALLQVMFDHANMGGFEGAFTNANTLDVLRSALTETAQNVIGDGISQVLIIDLARQDV